VEDRVYWIKLLKELRQSLIDTENTVEASWGSKERGNSRVGVWIEKMTPVIPNHEEDTGLSDNESNTESTRTTPGAGMSAEMRKRYGLDKVEPAAPAEPAAAPVSTNEIVTVNLTCTAINLLSHGPQENVKLIATFHQFLRDKTNLFVPEETVLGQNYTPPASNAPTFNFEMTLKLRRPMKI
jgi:hypothetical protein